MSNSYSFDYLIGQTRAKRDTLLEAPARYFRLAAASPSGHNRIERIHTLGEAPQVALDRQTWFELYELAVGQPVP